MDESDENICKNCGEAMVIDQDPLTLEPCGEPENRCEIALRRCRGCGLAETRVEYPDGRTTEWEMSRTAMSG